MRSFVEFLRQHVTVSHEMVFDTQNDVEIPEKFKLKLPASTF